MGAAAVIGGAAVVSAGVGAYSASQSAKAQSKAAQSAADTSAGAAMYSADIQKQMYDQTRQDQTPWRDAGVNALAQLTQGTGIGGDLIRPFSMADYAADPGYAFRVAEGQQAIDRSAAARNGLQSGAALKAAARYGQDMGSQEYQNAYNRYQSDQANKFNRLASIAGVGQTANNALAQAGSNYANNASSIATNNAANQGNAQLAAGQANASAYQAYGNAAGQAVNALGNYYSNQQASRWVNPDTGSYWNS